MQGFCNNFGTNIRFLFAPGGHFSLAGRPPPHRLPIYLSRERLREAAATPLSVGLTGSLGSGKSFVESCFRDLGHPVLDADQVVRELTKPDGEALPAIRESFGDEAFHADGTMNRQAVAKRVFSDSEERKRLEAILHPLVRRAEEEFLQKYQGSSIPILSIPLLFETGAETMVTYTVVVAVEDHIREQRLAQREDRLTPEEIKKRLAAQMPQSEKISKADYVIDNNGTREETHKQVAELSKALHAKLHA